MFNKLLFLIRSPSVVLVLGSGKETAREAISAVVNRYFKFGGGVIILDQDSKDIEFFLKKSRLPIFVATNVGEYHPEKEFFAGDLKDVSEIAKLASLLSANSHLVLNFDDETVRDVKNNSKAHLLTFGFGMRADIRSTDVLLTQFPAPGTNFKINYDGNIVPCWLENLFGKENIYAALAAAAAGLALGLNLVEISESLKTFRGLKGKLQLVRGIKNSLILDDTDSASSLSMLESLSVLKDIEGVARKIAVLGDIMNVGKYAIEAHESIGEKVKGSADLLFTVGERAKFFAQGAVAKGMAEDKVFQFDDAASAAKALQQEIKEGDLVLVDGSKEMNMVDIVEEVKSENFG